MSNILSAMVIAIKAHGGRLDKSGVLEVLHPIRVMNMLPHEVDDTIRMAALFHDIPEDTRFSIDWIRKEMISYHIDESLIEPTLRLVKYLTHNEGESYHMYIDRLCQSNRAKMIKTADSTDNMQRDHSGISDVDVITMFVKYKKSLNTIAMSYIE